MSFSTESEQIKKFENDEVAQHYFEVLRTLISKKSIFAQQIGLKEVATYLGEIFTAAGAKVMIDDSYTAPFVLAEFQSENPEAKTIIFYHHYDTVPADNDQPWTNDPFTLTVHYGVMYGRGVDDDKGHITARLTAVRKYIREHGSLPVNIIFMMEGAEESASTDLDKYLAKHKKQLRGADLLVWEQGTRNNLGQLEISGGNKGIVTFDMSVRSAEVDIHSSYGGVINSASWYLMDAISSLRSVDGRILVEGIYEQVQEPNERELALIAQYALKTILPAYASAKMEVRLVPGLEPHDVLDKIRKQLDKNGYDKVELTYTLGEMSYRSDMSAPSILNVIELAKDFYPEGISVLPTSAGTGPMHTVFEALEVPMAAFGLGNANSRDHGGDENVKIADYYTHIELIKELIRSYEQ